MLPKKIQALFVSLQCVVVHKGSIAIPALSNLITKQDKITNYLNFLETLSLSVIEVLSCPLEKKLPRRFSLLTAKMVRSSSTIFIVLKLLNRSFELERSREGLARFMVVVVGGGEFSCCMRKG